MADPARLTGVRASLALVRHGESTWIEEGRFQGHADPPLSQRGEQQAAAVAGRLADSRAAPALPLPGGPPIRIWHSPLVRAAATAEAIAARHPDIPAVSDPDLAELGQGEWEGLYQHEVRSRYATELAAWRADPVHHHAPGGESLPDAAARARAALARIIESLGAVRTPTTDLAPTRTAEAPAEPVLGYRAPESETPSIPLPWGIVVAHDGILRLLVLDLLGIPLDRYWTLPFGLCCVSVVDLGETGARLRAHNLAEHHDRAG